VNGLGLSDAAPQPQTSQDATPPRGRRLTTLNRSGPIGIPAADIEKNGNYSGACQSYEGKIYFPLSKSLAPSR
jgi:hypothetical protein